MEKETIKIGINGFGRIGRMFQRLIKHDIYHSDWMMKGNFEIAAINDLTDVGTLAYLLQNDSVHGKYRGIVETAPGALIVDEKRIPIISFDRPSKIPWKDYGVDIVVESTGRFAKYDEKNLEKEWAINHVLGDMGAGYVVVSAPVKGPKGAAQTIVMGVNEHELDTQQYRVISNASCTTNCLAPVFKVLYDNFGFEQGYMDTIHAYTNDQSILDQPHSDIRRTRTAALNIIPTSTGASSAIKQVIQGIDLILGSYSLRVPVADVSMVSLTALLGKEADAETVNSAMREASEKMPHIIEYCTGNPVSSDLIGNTHSAIFDSRLTYAGGRLVNVKAWYDNEAGYAQRLVDLVNMAGSQMKNS